MSRKKRRTPRQRAASAANLKKARAAITFVGRVKKSYNLAASVESYMSGTRVK